MKVKLPAFEIWQKDVFDYYLLNQKGKWIVTKSQRQVGKSIFAQLLLVYASLSKGNSVSLSISPIISQARKMYQNIESLAKSVIKKANGSTLEITFINGSQILFRSAEQEDSVRGNTVKGSGIAIVDEAAYIKDDFFYSILVPTCNVFKSPIFIFSTPKQKSGFFFDLFTQGLAPNEKVKSFDWTTYDTSKYLDDETKEIYRKQMPKLSFQSEILGQFIDGQGTVFTEFNKCICNTELDYSLPITIGIDWGTGSGEDYTVLTLAQIQMKKIVIPEQIAFNDKKPADQIRYILKIIKSIVEKGCKEINIIVEKNSIGAVYHSNLIEEIDEFEQNYNAVVDWRDEIVINCGTFLTTNKSKKDLIETLITLFEQDKIYIPDIEELKVQLSLFEAKVNKETGFVTYACFAPGSHDDRVLSLLFAISQLKNEV